MMRTLFVLFFLLFLSACGNGVGGSSSTSAAPPPIPIGSVSGSSFDGLISGATISVYDFTTGAKGALLTTAKSDNAGLYTLSLQIESKPLLIEATGGSYTEEADNKQVTLNSTHKLIALVNYTTGTPLQSAVTTLTHVAAAMAEYNIGKGVAVAKAITDANKRISDIFTLDVSATLPKSIADISNASVALTPEIKYGFISGAISKWTLDNAPSVGVQHLTPFTSIDFAQIMFRDILADGKLDGMGLDSSNTPIQLGFGSVPLTADTYRYGIATSLIAIASDPNNKAGINANGILAFAQTYGSNTDPVFAGVAPKQVNLPVPPVVIPTGSVSGKAFDGLISNGTVSIYDFTTGAKGNVLGTATTDNAGLYSISLQITSRPVLIEITGGYYTEEATGTNVQLSAKQPVNKLTALINYTQGTPIQTAVTTYSHMAAGLAVYEISKGTVVSTAINDANNRFSYIIGVSVLNTIPKQITDASNVSVSLTPELKYGFLAGAISTWVHDNASTYYSIDFAQLAYNDISADGLLDGIGLDSLGNHIQLGLGTTPLTTNNYRRDIGAALVKMAGNTNSNKTGITPTQILSYAQQYAMVVDSVFNNVTPTTFLPPLITVNASPVAGSFVRRTINLSATVSSPILSSTSYLIDGAIVGVASNPAAPSFSLDTTTIADGVHTIGIKSSNFDGNSSTVSISIKVDNTAPTLTLVNYVYTAHDLADQATVSGNDNFSGTVFGTKTFTVAGQSYPSVTISDTAGNCSNYTIRLGTIILIDVCP